MTLPNFLVIGAAKSGTTSLYHYLRSHPQIAMSRTKELDFFSLAWERGLGWYRSQFTTVGGAVAVGEASPSYAKAHLYPEAAARIAEVLPDVRLIYLLRDPIARMRSEYFDERSMGRDQRPLGRALREGWRYLGTSRYAFQLARHLEHTERRRVLLLLSEDLRDRRQDVLRRAFEFLAVDPTFEPPNLGEVRNRTSHKRVSGPLAEEIRDAGAYRRVRRYIPRTLRRFAARLATHPVAAERQDIPPELYAELTARLADDVRALYPHMGPGFDGWGIA